MNLYEYLIDTFGYNEPILTSKIQYKEYSKPWLAKELNKLCDSGQLVRYEKGVYYIPTDTLLGRSVLNPLKVIEAKYIYNGEDIVGYYSGVSAMNRMGLSTQMPNTLEIYSNNEMSRVRSVSVGKQQFVLRRARTEITKDNVETLQFLELMNSLSSAYLDEERKRKIQIYVQESGITRKSITQYAPFFPDNAMRMLIESEAIYSVAQ